MLRSKNVKNRENKSTLWYRIRPQTHYPGQGKTRKHASAPASVHAALLPRVYSCVRSLLLPLCSLIGSTPSFGYWLCSPVRLLALSAPLPRSFIGFTLLPRSLIGCTPSRVGPLALAPRPLVGCIPPLAVLLPRSSSGRSAPGFVHGLLSSPSGILSSALLPPAFAHWFCSRVRSTVRFFTLPFLAFRWPWKACFPPLDCSQFPPRTFFVSPFFSPFDGPRLFHWCVDGSSQTVGKFVQVAAKTLTFRWPQRPALS